jgi:hypothetical protein
LVNPVITCDNPVLPALLSVPPAGLDVTVYPVIGEPPSDAGAVKVTVAVIFPAVADAPVGAPGAAAIAAPVRAAEASTASGRRNATQHLILMRLGPRFTTTNHEPFTAT